MTQRSFDDGFWSDPFVQSLDKEAKYLFAYLWTNKQCNSAGLYEITTKTIAFDTGIDEGNLSKLFEALKPKITWLSENNIVWVRNFVKRQPKSPQFLTAVANCLKNVSNNGILKEFLDYNGKLGVSIPYQYPIGTDAVPYAYALDIDKDIDKDIDNREGVVGGEVKTGLIFKTFDENFQRITETTKEQLSDLIEQYKADAVIIAMNKAIKQNKRRLAYVEGILKKSGETGSSDKYSHMVRK